MSTEKIHLGNFASRLGEVIGRSGLNQREFANKLRVSASHISDLVNGKSSPSESFVRLVTLAFDVDEKWLLTGEGKIITAERQLKGAQQPPDGYLALDIRHAAGGGNGQFNELAEIIGQVVIPESWAAPSIVPVKLRGKSMEPSIMNDAIVGVDKEDKAIISGELYAVMIPYEGVVVKRLFFEADKIQVHSDNPLYPSFAIAHREIGDHFLIGRVKWVVQRL